MLSKSAKRTLGLIGRANSKSEARPRFFLEKGKFRYPDGREIKGAGVHELVAEGVLVPSGDGLLPGTSQTYVFDPGCAKL